MKKTIVALILFLFMISSAYSFDILGSDGNKRTYFSINSPEVEVVSEIQFENFSLYYTLINTTHKKVFDLEKCSNKYCGSFELDKLIESQNNSFVGSKIFTINVGSENRTIYFDLEKPKFNVTNYTINKKDKKINFKFEYSDNSNLIKEVKFYVTQGKTTKLIKTFTDGEKTYSYDLTESGDITYEFRTFDVAGNQFNYDLDLEIPDLFAPNIKSSFLIIRENRFDLEFELTDDNLTRFEIKQGDLSLTQNIDNKKSFKKTVELPYTSGKIVLEAYDSDDNVAKKTIELKKDALSVSFKSDYTNDDRVVLESSQASKCVLTEFDGDDYNKKFSEDDNEFRVNVDVDDDGSYDVDYYCENSNYRKYFTSEFVYDTEEPTLPVLDLEATDDGYVRASWSKSIDDESSKITYKLYRDGDREFQTDDEDERDYKDDEVDYPETYDYYLEAIDQAGNKVTTKEKSISPKKVRIEFESNLAENQQVTSNAYNFKIATEKNTKVTIKVRKDNEIIDIKNYNVSTGSLEVPLSFTKGINQVIVETTDSLDNIRQDVFFVTYEDEVLSGGNGNLGDNDIISEPKNDSQVIIEQTDDSGLGLWFWLLILVAIAFFVYLFVFWTRYDIALPKRNSRTSSRKSGFNFKSTHKDTLLSKDLMRIKRSRIQRQEERAKERQRRKEKETNSRPMSALEKQKFADLGSKRLVSIPSEVREKSKKRANRIRHEAGNKETEVVNSRFDKKSDKKGFFSKFSSSDEVKKEDPMSNYIDKIKSTKSWSNPKEYRAKTDAQIQAEIQKEQELQKKVQKEESKLKEKDGTKDNKSSKVDLDEYLNKRSKKKSFFFAEKEVDRELNKRKE